MKIDLRSSHGALWMAVGLGVLVLAVPFGITVRAGDRPAALQPRLFAPGIVSTGDEEFSPAFSPDGKSVFFTKGSPGRIRVLWIMESHWRDGRWTEPVVAPFSGGYSDIDPTFSVDGKQIVFASNRPLTGTKAREDFDLWIVERTADGWSEPRHLGDKVNSAGSESTTSLAADGTLYIGSAARPGGVPGPGRHLYRSRLVNGEYGDVEALPELINAGEDVSNQYIAPDGSWLIFLSKMKGETDSTLYLTRWKDGAWTAPVNLDPELNTTYKAFTPVVSADGKTLYFSSRRGLFDVLPPARMTAREFTEAIRRPENGLGDIYSVPMSRFAAVLGTTGR